MLHTSHLKVVMVREEELTWWWRRLREGKFVGGVVWSARKPSLKSHFKTHSGPKFWGSLKKFSFNVTEKNNTQCVRIQWYEPLYLLALATNVGIRCICILVLLMDNKIMIFRNNGVEDCTYQLPVWWMKTTCFTFRRRSLRPDLAWRLAQRARFLVE